MNPDLVLVVDDDVACRNVICAVLEELLGVRTVGAGDGKQALLLVNLLKPAVVVLDMVLPALSGMEVAKLLKSNPATKAIPVIALTALYRAAGPAAAAGCDLCVEKPFGIYDFANAVNAFLNRSKPQRTSTCKLEATAKANGDKGESDFECKTHAAPEDANTTNSRPASSLPLCLPRRSSREPDMISRVQVLLPSPSVQAF